MKPAWISAVAVVLALGAVPASAQMVVAAKSGVVNYTEGAVRLNDQPVESTVTHYPDIKENGVLSTADGRAEVLLTPGVVLRLGENSSIKMLTNRLIDTRLELLSGSAVVEADQVAKDTKATVVVRDGAASIAKAGVYRFDAQPAQVKVLRGEAVVEKAGVSTPVGANRLMALEGTSHAVEKFNAEDTDALDHWSRRRGEYMSIANVSAAKSMSLGFSPMGCVSSWRYNMWFGMNTYVPCSGYLMSPYGYGFFSPLSVMGLAWGGYGYGYGRGYGYYSGYYGGGAPAAASGPLARSTAQSFAAASHAVSDGGSFSGAHAGGGMSGGSSGGGSVGSHGGGPSGGGMGGGGGHGGGGGGHGGR